MSVLDLEEMERLATQTEHFACEECGPHVGCDEDGCCTSCGGDATTAPCCAADTRWQALIAEVRGYREQHQEECQAAIVVASDASYAAGRRDERAAIVAAVERWLDAAVDTDDVLRILERVKAGEHVEESP